MSISALVWRTRRCTMLGFNPVFGVFIVLLVTSGHVTSGLPCTFNIAGAVTLIYCETQCCDNACCGRTQTDSSTSGIVLGVIAAVVLVVIVVVLVVCCCKHRCPCQSNKEGNSTQAVSPIIARRSRARHDEVISLQDIEHHPQGVDPPDRSVGREGTFSIIP